MRNKKTINSFIITLAITTTFSLFCKPYSKETPYTIATNYIGITETDGNNRSKQIDSFNKYAGVKLGSSWCCSFMKYCYRFETLDFTITAGCLDTYSRAKKVNRTQSSLINIK